MEEITTGKCFTCGKRIRDVVYAYEIDRSEVYKGSSADFYGPVGKEIRIRETYCSEQCAMGYLVTSWKKYIGKLERLGQ